MTCICRIILVIEKTIREFVTEKPKAKPVQQVPVNVIKPMTKGSSRALAAAAAASSSSSSSSSSHADASFTSPNNRKREEQVVVEEPKSRRQRK